MSQSNAHVDLIKRVAAEIKSRYPNIALVVDIQENPGDPVPQLVGDFRPDVYAHLSVKPSMVIIAEAKTTRVDMERERTYNQIKAFIEHVERKKNGSFILSVGGGLADCARTLLRLLSYDIGPKHATLSVFDGHDFWSFDKTSGGKWRLN